MTGSCEPGGRTGRDRPDVESIVAVSNATVERSLVLAKQLQGFLATQLEQQQRFLGGFSGNITKTCRTLASPRLYNIITKSLGYYAARLRTSLETRTLRKWSALTDSYRRMRRPPSKAD